jgi:hypothetical protein
VIKSVTKQFLCLRYEACLDPQLALSNDSHRLGPTSTIFSVDCDQGEIHQNPQAWVGGGNVKTAQVNRFLCELLKKIQDLFTLRLGLLFLLVIVVVRRQALNV